MDCPRERFCSRNEGTTEAVGSLLPDEDDIATQHQKIAELLEKSEKRFLVVVDDSILGDLIL